MVAGGAVCPFGQEVGTEPTLERCPLLDGDLASCLCLAEVVAHACGGADDQTTHICAWWARHHVFDCGWPQRQRLPGFRADGDRP